MEKDKVIAQLREISLMLDKCADDVPYELSAKEDLYFRMVEMAKEAEVLIKEMQEQ